MADNTRKGPAQGPSAVSAAAKRAETEPQDTGRQAGARLLNLATAPRKTSEVWPQLAPVTWEGLLGWLDLEHPGDHRECGSYVPGLFRDQRRNADHLVSRSVLTLDADKAGPFFLADVARVLPGVAAAVHSTWRHRTEEHGDRYRLLVPLSRDLDGVQYKRVAEAVRDALGHHWGADRGCPSPVQFMYRPSTQGDYLHRVFPGAPLDVDRWLLPELHPYAARAIEAELARLDELDLLGLENWNITTHAVACNLIEFANGPWSGYTLERAEDDLLAHAPTDEGFGPTQHVGCWESALKGIGDKGRSEPAGDPADDFDVVARAATPDAFAAEVERAAQVLRIRRAAQELVTREQQEQVELPELTTLSELLDEPDEEARFRVEGLMPTGGRVVFAAPNKAGKTTMIANLVRCLVDGGDFLGKFTVQRAQRVVLLDNELDRRMIRSWLRDQDIDNAKAVEVLTLRGKLSGFNILDPVVRADWAARLGPADLLVFDCLRPALDALGLSEDKDAGRFLVALDALVAEAGIGELVVVHHMGHSSERSRGDSRILDWPDALWKLVKADAEDHSSARFFSAYGRDVDQPESQLSYDSGSRRLALTGGSRHQARGSAVEAAVFAFVQDNPGCSGGVIERGVPGDNNAIRAARASLIAGGFLRTVDGGPGKAKQHFLGDDGASDFAEEP